MKKESTKIKLRENQNKRINRQLSHKIKLLNKKNQSSTKPSEKKIFTILKYSHNMKWYNIWQWPKELYDDIRVWFVIRGALNESETIEKFKSFKYELRVDKIGRIYTVINIPEELWPLEYQDQAWPWMLEQLRELDELLMTLRLNELVYPDVTRLEGQPAYLVILSPSSDSISLWKFISWLFRCGLVSVSLFLINKLIIKFVGESIINSLIALFY